ncbi:MAG: LysR family transcriptional regulator [Deltaproteobacteria bacterium]|nr:LysR family transcriptional regulator [Deltaproteobacteria bacterium]
MHQFNSPLRIDQIQALIAVASYGSFAAAANALDRDSSVITRRIRALEAHLGVRLLERTTRRIGLTEAGNTYLRKVRPLIEELATIHSNVASQGVLPQGTLRISIPNTYGRLRIAPILPKFLSLYPDVQLDVRLTDRYVSLVDENFDLAIRIGHLEDSRLVARKIATFRRHLYASPRYLKKEGTPNHPTDLKSHYRLKFPTTEGPEEWRLIRANRRVSVSPPIRLTADDFTTLVNAATAGVGVIEAAEWLVEDELRARELVPVLNEWVLDHEVGVYLVTQSGRLLPSKTRAFIDWLVTEHYPRKPQDSSMGMT